MDVESAADLYGLEPAAFVAARDALAKQLRAAGDKDEAALVKALRRPTVAAWALNVAARAEPALVDELLDAADAARRAHDDVLAGASGGVLRDALARRRDAIRAVAQRAREVLEENARANDTQQREIDTLLDQAVDSETTAAALRAGTMTAATDRESAPDDLVARLAASVTDAPSPPRPAAARAPKASPDKGTAKKTRDRLLAAVNAARQAAEAADRDVASAAKALAEASAAHTEAVRERTKRTSALAEAEAALAALET